MGPSRRSDRKSPPLSEIDVLWITAGLGCDGDTIAITAATQPSIEDIILGGLPWIPKVHFHNPFLASENGDDFMKFWYEAEKGKLDPFVLVVEGSIPNESIKKEGYWAGLGTDPHTGQPGTRDGADAPDESDRERVEERALLADRDDDQPVRLRNL